MRLHTHLIMDGRKIMAGKPNLEQLEGLAGAVAAGAAPDDLERRIVELERWRDRVWRNPQALAKRLEELLQDQDQWLLGAVGVALSWDQVVAVTGVVSPWW